MTNKLYGIVDITNKKYYPTPPLQTTKRWMVVNIIPTPHKKVPSKILPIKLVRSTREGKRYITKRKRGKYFQYGDFFV